MIMEKVKKPVVWVGTSKKEIQSFPDDVKHDMGMALKDAQYGEKPLSAKPLKGFKGAGTLEIVEDHDGDTYRAMYTVKFKGVVYVLHVFKKKSKKGIATPKNDIDLVKERLKQAEEHYNENSK